MRSVALTLLCMSCTAFDAFAQAPAPSPKASVTVRGCLASEQRDGSLGAKATGTTVTPATAAMEANNPAPSGAFLLLAADAATATPDEEATSYALKGQEKELVKHRGHQVEITGTLLPPLAAKLSSRGAAAAEGIRSIEVASIKMIAATCPPAKK